MQEREEGGGGGWRSLTLLSKKRFRWIGRAALPRHNLTLLKSFESRASSWPSLRDVLYSLNSSESSFGGKKGWRMSMHAAAMPFLESDLIRHFSRFKIITPNEGLTSGHEHSYYPMPNGCPDWPRAPEMWGAVNSLTGSLWYLVDWFWIIARGFVMCTFCRLRWPAGW